MFTAHGWDTKHCQVGFPIGRADVSLYIIASKLVGLNGKDGGSRLASILSMYLSMIPAARDASPSH